MLKLIYRIIVLCLTCVTLTSCTLSSLHYYQVAVKTWDGSHRNTLVQVLGQPDMVISEQNGHMLYIYRTLSADFAYAKAHVVNLSRGETPAMVSIPGTYNPVLHHHFSQTCLAIFEVNQQGIIIKTEARGTHCLG